MREGAVVRFVAWLLALANAGAGGVRRREFYALKDRLLQRFGRRVGEDVQRIVRECWGDDQEGCAGKTCWRCRGTGVWETSLILLQRWEVAGRVFHRPDRRVYGDAWRVTIEGRITHATPHRTSAEALLWLTLLFDRPLFWRILTSSRCCGWQWRPMLALQSLVFQMRHVLGPLKPRRCVSCGQRFIRPFARTVHWFTCQRCSTRTLAFDDDLPF